MEPEGECRRLEISLVLSFFLAWSISACTCLTLSCSFFSFCRAVCRLRNWLASSFCCLATVLRALLSSVSLAFSTRMMCDLSLVLPS